MRERQTGLSGQMRFSAILLTILLLNISAAQDASTEKATIEQVIHASIGWAKEKDFNLLHSVIANDSDYVSVNPNKRVVMGYEEFRKAEKFWGSPDFKALRYEIRDLKINIARSGDVAWYYCVLDDVNEWKGKPASWMNARWTGVLEKREGRWVIVQMHFSFAKEG